MSEAPELIWLTHFVKDEYGARLGRGIVSDLDHGDNPDYPKYVRADRIEVLVKERDGLLTTWAESRERHISSEARAERLEAAVAILEDALQEAGDDYPGSSMQQWCQQQVKAARAALTGGKDE